MHDQPSAVHAAAVEKARGEVVDRLERAARQAGAQLLRPSFDEWKERRWDL